MAGGKGRASRRTPEELVEHGLRTGLDGERLAYTSRITAKVDSAAVQDGFQIYHHTFLHTSTGEWAVVQQGMREGDAAARRYHWLGERVRDVVDEPHAAIASSAPAGAVLNLVDHASAGARAAITALARERPETVAREAARIGAALGDAPARRPAPPAVLRMPPGHAVDVRRDLDPTRLHQVLLRTYEAAPVDFEALLALPGVGARSVRALALVAELVHGEAASVRDPARFSFAHGGKDGHPYPVDRATYDGSVEWLRDAVARARLGRSERADALRRLARWSDGGA